MTHSRDITADFASASMDDLRRAVQLLMDEREIREVLHRYVHACDRLDDEELRTVYHSGAYDDHGPLRGPDSEFVPNVLAALESIYTFCSHTVGQSRIEWIGADQVVVETYTIAVTGREVDDGEVLDVVGGRYIDKLSRVDSVWKIADRLFVPDYDASIPRTRWQNPAEWTIGLRNRDDPSYKR
ncbi:MAG: nuclear transport factor 2 family protein [Marmoricola sp.]